MFTPSPRRFLPPFVDSPVVSLIHLLPCCGVLLRRCGVLIHCCEVLPCRRRVLSHRHGVLCVVIVGDLLGRVEAGAGTIRRGLHGWGGNSSCWSFITSGLGRKWSLGWHEMNRNGHDVCHGSCFMTYHMGLPIPGSPLVFPSP